MHHRCLIIAGVIAALGWAVAGSRFVDAAPPLVAKATTPIPPDTPTPMPPTSTPTVDERLARIEQRLTESSATATIKDLFDTLQSIATIVAIAVGGWWGWRLYRQYRESYPRAKVDQQITHRRLSTDKWLLHIVVRVKNISKVLVAIEEVEVQIRQIIPLRPRIVETIQQYQFPPEGAMEFDWPAPFKLPGPMQLAQGIYSAEPNETVELYFDFVLDSEVQTVSIYSYVRDVTRRKRNLGWPKIANKYIGRRNSYNTNRSDTDDENIGWYTQTMYDLVELPSMAQPANHAPTAESAIVPEGEDA